MPKQTVASKLAGVVRQTDVDMPAVANRIVDSMRNGHAVRPTRKVMIERLERFAAADSSGSIELAQAFFRFGVDGEIGISGGLIFVDQFGNPYELNVTVGRGTAGNNFADLPQPQLLVVHPLPNRFVANRRSHGVKSFRKSSRRKIGEHNRLVIGVAAGSRL